MRQQKQSLLRAVGDGNLMPLALDAPAISQIRGYVLPQLIKAYRKARLIVEQARPSLEHPGSMPVPYLQRKQIYIGLRGAKRDRYTRLRRRLFPPLRGLGCNGQVAEGLRCMADLKTAAQLGLNITLADQHVIGRNDCVA
jgi:hypothetical protein